MNIPTLLKLKAQEAEAFEAFSAACRAVLDAAESVQALHNPIMRAAGQPTEHPHFSDAVTGCKAYLDRQAHQARTVEHRQEIREQKARRPAGKTYTLKRR